MRDRNIEILLKILLRALRYRTMKFDIVAIISVINVLYYGSKILKSEEKYMIDYIYKNLPYNYKSGDILFYKTKKRFNINFIETLKNENN